MLCIYIIKYVQTKVARDFSKYFNFQPKLMVIRVNLNQFIYFIFFLLFGYKKNGEGLNLNYA